MSASEDDPIPTNQLAAAYSAHIPSGHFPASVNDYRGIDPYILDSLPRPCSFPEPYSGRPDEFPKWATKPLSPKRMFGDMPPSPPPPCKLSRDASECVPTGSIGVTDGNSKVNDEQAWRDSLITPSEPPKGEFVVLLHDVYEVTFPHGEYETPCGDADDAVAAVVAQRLSARLGVTVVIYCTGGRLEWVKKFFKGVPDFEPPRLTGCEDPSASWFLAYAKAICMCGPLSKIDAVAVNTIRRRPDNSNNVAQGEVSNETIGGKPDFNFANSTGATSDEWNAWFPSQYKSRMTKQSCPVFVESCPSAIKSSVYGFAFTKVACPPDADLRFALGLLLKKNGQAVNSCDTKILLILNGLATGVSPAAIENPDPAVFFTEYAELKQLDLGRPMITKYVEASNTAYPKELSEALAGIISLTQNTATIGGKPLYAANKAGSEEHRNERFLKMSELIGLKVTIVGITVHLYDPVTVAAFMLGYTGDQFNTVTPRIEVMLGLSEPTA